jgi:chromosome segregation and condensation protein ScpB
MNIDLANKIEALLFYEGGTMQKRALLAALTCGEGELLVALLHLRDSLVGRGLQIIDSSTDISLRFAPSVAAFIEQYDGKQKQEALGAARIEVLAILLYRGASTQAEIDSIRGVASSISLRSLRASGYISKDDVAGENGTRSVYTLTSDALVHLGFAAESDAPEYAATKDALRTFEDRLKNV